VLLAATALVLVVSHFSVVHANRPTRILLGGRDVVSAVGFDPDHAKCGAPSHPGVNSFQGTFVLGTNPMNRRQ